MTATVVVVTVTVQVVPLDVSQPVHDVKVEPAAGVAVRVYWVGDVVTTTAHAEPQSIPAGVDVTVPVPLPASCTLAGG